MAFFELYCSQDQYYYTQYAADFQQECLAAKIRLSMFLIIGDCVGLPVLAWAFHVLYCHCKSGGRISVFMITLLLCDLLLLLLNPYIVIKLLQNANLREDSTYWLLSFWSASVFTGLHLQQVMALEGALSVRHPLCSAHVFFPSCSIVISLVVFISVVICEVNGATPLIHLGVLLLLVINITSWIVTCRAPPQTDNTAYRSGKPSSEVLVFVTLPVVLYVTFITMILVFFRLFSNLPVIYLCLLSVRGITDPLLCVLVCKKNLRFQKSTTTAEPNTDIELTQTQSSHTTYTVQEV